jgi:hypothetical protein
MKIGATTAGMAFSNAGVWLVRGMSGRSALFSTCRTACRMRGADPSAYFANTPCALCVKICLVELDLDFAVDDADGVGFQIFGCRWVEHLSGANVETRRVQRALDQLTVEPAIR